MDEYPQAREPSCHFGPDRRLTAAIIVIAFVAALAAILTSDPFGRLLFIAAAVVLAGYGTVDLLYWPRLRADRRVVVVRTPFGSGVVPWDQIEHVGADVRERYGIRSTTLEIDASGRLLVFSRRALGANPADVAQLLRAFDPRDTGLEG